MTLFFYKYLHNKKIYKMSEFTTGTVKDLRYLYENVVHGEQEVLGEAGFNPYGTRERAAAISREGSRQIKSVVNPLGAATDEYQKSGPRQVKGAPINSLAQNQKVASLPANARQVTQYPQGVPTGAGGGNAGASRSTPTPRPAAPSTTAVGSPARPVATSAARPVATPAARASAAPTRPTATNAKAIPAAKPAGSAMDQWAKANPTLAAASAERARIRGTSQTDNPLMKDFKSSLPTNSPSVQAPAVANLANKSTTLSGNQSLVNNPNAFKAAPAPTRQPTLKPVTPSAAIAAAPSSSAAASGSVTPITRTISATPKPIIPNPSGTPMRKEPLKNSYEYDAYNLVLEYLLNDGHAVTIAEAEYIMTRLDEETIQNICEVSGMGGEVHPTKNVYTGRLNPHDQEYRLQTGRSKSVSGESKARNRDPGAATGLALSPRDRANKRANALRSRGDSASNKRANKIDKFVKSSDNENIARITAYNDGKRDGKNYMRNAKEVTEWVNELVEEGYDLSEYSWDDMVDHYFSEARVDAGKTDDEKRTSRSERGTIGSMHLFFRKDKKRKGAKPLSSTGKYSQMLHDKKQAQRERDGDEQRRRDRSGGYEGGHSWGPNPDR